VVRMDKRKMTQRNFHQLRRGDEWVVSNKKMKENDIYIYNLLLFLKFTQRVPTNPALLTQPPPPLSPHTSASTPSTNYAIVVLFLLFVIFSWAVVYFVVVRGWMGWILLLVLLEFFFRSVLMCNECVRTNQTKQIYICMRDNSWKAKAFSTIQ
jgi:hypothetical protein